MKHRIQFLRRRRAFITLLGGTAAAWPLAARAQQAMPMIGFLSSASPGPFAHLVANFRKGLSEGGFTEGQNITIEFHWAQDQYDRLPALAADLARKGVTVIAATGGDASALAAKAATSTIPVVFTIGGDPVKLGLVASLNSPGGNVTGVTLLTGSLEEKRLGLLHELVPRATVIAMLVNQNSPLAPTLTNDVQAAALVLGKQVLILHASNEPEVEAAFDAMVKQRVGALMVTADPFFFLRRAEIVALAAHHALPAIFEFREVAVAGGLLSYGTSIAGMYGQAGVYTARILKGAKPADLPVVQPTKFELVINLKTAKALGIEFPLSMQLLADEVIE
jgi:putative ABC transport system substrate-binding protein